MPTLKQWADAHGATAVGRVAKRIERFAGNTTDPATSLAAEDLIKMIREVTPKEKKNAEPEAE